MRPVPFLTPSYPFVPSHVTVKGDASHQVPAMLKAQNGQRNQSRSDSARLGVLTPSRGIYAPRMRNIETIDSELGLLAAIRQMVREAEGRPPPTAYIDGLLDERRKLAQLSRFSV